MNNLKNTFIFIVSDTGGTPILSVPEIPYDRINIMCSMVSVIDSIASTIQREEASISSFHISDQRLLCMRRKKLVFLLILPMGIDTDIALKILRDLTERFIKLFGEDPDEARSVTLFDAGTTEEFKRGVMGVLMNVVTEHAPEYFDVLLEELFTVLKGEGADVSKISAKFVLANVPFIVEGRDISKVKDDLDSKILGICDGRKTVQEIAKELSIPASEVYKRLAKLNK